MARTNRLIDRICQTYSDGESVWNISINQFKASLTGVLGGYLTSAQVVGYWGLSTGEETDWNTLVARVNAYPNTGNTNPRDRATNWMVSVLNLYEEQQVSAFQTPDQVWAWLTSV